MRFISREWKFWKIYRRGNNAKINDFREYDIRGIYNEDLTRENVTRIGYLLGLELQKRGGRNLGVGYDARVHSEIIFDWFCQGVLQAELVRII